jgi:hypothetical protein
MPASKAGSVVPGATANANSAESTPAPVSAK